MRNVEDEFDCSHTFFLAICFFCCSVSLDENTESSLRAKVTRKLVVASVEEESCLEGGT